MRARSNGISLTKHEITALLAVAAAESEREEFAAVAFEVDSDAGHCYAHATNGKAAIECTAPADKDALDGRWVVKRAFLKMAHKQATGKDEIVLDVGPVDLCAARILSHEDDETNERCRIVWPGNALLDQLELQFPRLGPVVRFIKEESATPCMTLAAHVYGMVELMARAAAATTVDGWWPRSRLIPAGFEVVRSWGEWRMVAAPKVEASEKEDGDAVEKAADEFLAALAGFGASVTLEGPSGQTTTITPEQQEAAAARAAARKGKA